MSAQAASFQAPTSLVGTIAAYEARRKSESTTADARDVNQSPLRDSLAAAVPSADEIYQRSLPSLHFLRWRPAYHLQAPSGWMNDPCAPGFDITTGLYHVFFQWNPKRNIYGAVSWGNICWGHAVSNDMVNWTVSGTAAIKPGSWYDKEGCFTGCMLPTDLAGKNGGITLFYTGVSRLPLHYTLEYENQTETLAVASSTDHGKSFVKIHGNPILPEPPNSLVVTGWRDPYVARWPSMDTLLDHKDKNILYGFISGGVKDRGPTAFLYAVNPDLLTQWTFLSDLIELPTNHHISRWSGDMGINWECATFMTLASDVDGSQREFIIVGAEGSDTTHPNSSFTEHPQQQTKFPRAERSLQWMCGSLYVTPGPEGDPVPKMRYVSGGRFDHAAMYGVNSFGDARSGKHIAWGWITEEDLPQGLVDKQNWSGLLSIPRELSLQCIPNVTGALKSRLQDITSIEIEPDSNSRSTIRTLGISPAQSIESLRQSATFVEIGNRQTLRPGNPSFLDVRTCRFELAASFAVSDTCTQIGLRIHHDENLDPASSTALYLNTATETFLLKRPDSVKIDPGIMTYTEKAPFTLFTCAQPDRQLAREKLQIRAFFDESVLEVFVNDRCTFAARIYPTSKRCWGISFWSEDIEHQSELIMARVWDGLRADMKIES